MSKTKIEWVRNEDGSQGYTINPVKGLCPVACDYCYARAMYKRFKWNPEIRMEYSLWDDVKGIRKPSRIFIGSTMELFGEWIKPQWLQDIFETVKGFPFHTFIFLTKRPRELLKWSPFPGNCWVGVSVTKGLELEIALDILKDIKAKVKFISFEPLLGDVFPVPHIDFMKGVLTTKTQRLEHAGISWVIIGQQTPPSKKTSPKIEWVREIVEACDKVNIPVFLKNNLSSIWDVDLPKWAIRDGGLRQEFPRGMK